MPGGRSLLRGSLVRLARAEPARRVVHRPRICQDIVSRFVAGADATAGLDVAAVLLGKGRLVSLCLLTEGATTPDAVAERIAGYRSLLGQVAARGLGGAGRVDLSLALSRVGLDDDVAAAPRGRQWRDVLDQARSLCQAAGNAGVTVTVEAESLAAAEATHLVVADLRQDFPDVGISLPAAWQRTPGDAAELAGLGARVRLTRGFSQSQPGYLTDRADLDRGYVRDMRVLLQGRGDVGVFTHDPRILAIAEALGDRLGRTGRGGPGLEYVMRYGVRTETQITIADRGDRMRVLVPFGPDWYPYVVQRVADQPSQLLELIRAAAAR